jgi:hypothetical protein
MGILDDPTLPKRLAEMNRVLAETNKKIQQDEIARLRGALELVQEIAWKEDRKHGPTIGGFAEIHSIATAALDGK